jgi:hypothetical protein
LGWLGLNLHIFFFNLLSIILSHSHDSCNEFNELTWLTRVFFILFLIEWFLNPSYNVKLVWNWASWLFFNLFFCRGYSVIMTCVSSLTSLPSLTQVIFFIFFIYFLEFHLSIFGCLRIKFHDLSQFALCEGYHGLITWDVSFVN